MPHVDKYTPFIITCKCMPVDKLLALYMHIVYSINMKKDLNIRVSTEDHKILRKLSKKEGRTIKSMFKIVVRYYRDENQPELKIDETNKHNN